MNKINTVSKTKIKKFEKPEYTKLYYDEYNEILESSLKDLFLNQDFSIDTDEGSVDITFKSTIDGKDRDCNVGFSVRGFEYCCGCMEIGELSNGVLDDEDMNLLFEYIFSENKETIAITTIQSQKAWEGYLNKSQYFTAVKSFKANTENIITLWISNN